jgi:hypothetical protein
MRFNRKQNLTSGKLRIVYAVLLCALILTPTVAVILNREARAQPLPTPPELYADTQKAITDLTAAQTQVQSLLQQAQTANSQVIQTALTKAFASAGVDPTMLTSASALNTTAATDLVNKALSDAVGSGATSLTQLTSVGLAPAADLQRLVSGAISEGVSAGTVNLSQITNMGLANTADIQRLVNSSLNEVISGGVINMNQITNMGSLNAAQLQTIAKSALSEAVSSGISLTALQQNAIVSNAVTTLQGLSGTVDATAVKNALGGAFVATVPSLDLSTVLGSFGAGTTNTFSGMVQEKLVSDALAQVTGLSGVVNFSNIQSAIGNVAMSVTGSGSLASIMGTMGAPSIANFSNLVQGGIMNQALTSVTGLAGTVNLGNIQNTIAGSVLGATGLGNIASITGSFGAITSGNFTNTIKGAVTSQALSSISGMTGAFSLPDLQGALAGNILGATGIGSLGSITGSLTSINPTAITGAIQGSIMQNVLGGLGGLPTLSVPNIENLIGTNIMSITGTGNLLSISSAIPDSISTAIGSIGGITGQLQGALGSIQGAFSGLTNLSFNLDGLTSLNLTSLTSVFSSLTSIQGLIGNLSSTITGTLTGMMGSVTGIASGIFGSGIASITDLSGLTSAFSGISGGVTSMVTDSLDIGTLGTDISSMTSTISGGSSSVAGTPFGGMSAYVFFCTCSMNIAVTVVDLNVSPPAMLPLIFQPGASILYPYGQIYRSGVWTLGLWRPGGVCTYWVGKSCMTYPTSGTISMVGTSM